MVKKDNLKLTIELIPSSSWQNNLRALLKPSMWNDIRKKVYGKYFNRCAICGRRGKLHAHEVWSYDDETHTQKLADIIPLCFMCHMVKHIGFAGLQTDKYGGNYERFVRHFMKVNGVDRSTFQKHLREVLKTYEDRSKYEWQLEFEKLREFEK